MSSNKTVDNCFLRDECAETRSNASEACPREQNDYVSRERMQSAECRMQNSKIKNKRKGRGKSRPFDLS